MSCPAAGILITSRSRKTRRLTQAAIGFFLLNVLTGSAFPAEPLTSKSEFDSKVTVSAVRNKKTKIEGGDFDDKKDRITFTIKLRNSDPNRPFPGLKLEFYLFGQSMVNTKALQFLQKYEKELNLDPLQEVELLTPEVVTAWDNTGAIFGAKYKGWYLRVYGANGDLLAEKNTTTFLDDTTGLTRLQVNKFYTRKLQPINESL